MQNAKTLLKTGINHKITVIREMLNKKKRIEILSHKFYKTPTVSHLIVPDTTANDSDIFYAERLLSSYNKAIDDYRSPGKDIWSGISQNQSKFLSILKRNDPVELANYLCNMNREDATIGTIQGNFVYDRLVKDSSYRKHIALITKDKLVSLAEALGVSNIENPEQGIYGETMHQNPEELFENISAFIGHDLTPPAIDSGLLKIKVGNALVGERDISAIYTAYIIKSAMKVCEIGGGGGRACLWSKKFGVAEYTILDLPHINVVQGFYLLKSIPDSVSLFGEADKPVRIMPAHALPKEKFDLILNQDSFPEIDKSTVINYLNWIKGHCNEFMSINFESKASYKGGQHLNVSELIREVGGFNRMERVQYWLRKGYILERYSPVF